MNSRTGENLNKGLKENIYFQRENYARNKTKLIPNLTEMIENKAGNVKKGSI